MTTTEPDTSLVEKLVAANRILYDQGVVDGLGHISVRHGTAADTFMRRAAAPRRW